MLIEHKSKWLFLATFSTFVCLQFYSGIHNQLFGDEAFYWLESQHLAWSYAELPGWTQWAIGFTQWLLPQHELTVRLPSLMAAWSLPWIGMLICQKINPSEHTTPWVTGLLIMAIPLLAVSGIMAIPDIWLIFFGLLSVLILVMGLKTHQRKHFVLLGIILAFGINVHVRFWIIVLLAALVVLWYFRSHRLVIRNLILYSFPVMLIGFVPILIFNLQNDFSLLNFQLSERHPWQFQAAHISFFPIQLLVASPLVFWLCIQTIRQLSQLNPTQKSVALIAILHWLTYALVGFFSDNLRFNAHWTVFSYVLLMVLAGSIPTNNKLKAGSIITGVLGSFAIILTLYFGLHNSQPISQTNAQLTENFRGWQELADKTNTLIRKSSYDSVVADHFMTLAELKFYSKPNLNITSLSHPLNIKHGREQQLETMNYLQTETTVKGLLIVEHSGLKLDQMVPFYLDACETLHGIELIDSFDYSSGVKSYFYFKTGGGGCKLPPISYIETQDQQMTGWVLLDQEQTVKLGVHQNSHTLGLNISKKTLGSSHLFKRLTDQDYYLAEIEATAVDSSHFQLIIEYPNITIATPRIYQP